jgi:hypothetical protein
MTSAAETARRHRFAIARDTPRPGPELDPPAGIC